MPLVDDDHGLLVVVFVCIPEGLGQLASGVGGMEGGL